jgi:hypothetical protein
VRSEDEQRFIPGSRPGVDPQAELVRRYARILRSAPAEAWSPRTTAASAGRAMTRPRFGRAGTVSAGRRSVDAAPEA